eukprot:TRINITY_DN800_c0_g1_i2.p1 TRINITY_DN800_c0_g1~~TRINITY_DN800_c0_g1_i2.p1  ORF type:complete len:433 (-),score=134.89 TRINITY_DN800_c0_g1_i2:271-1569(-)
MKLILFIFVLLFSLILAQDPSYDHQTTTYTANHQPYSQNSVSASITPFFSPVHSVSVLTKLIEGAQQSLDIGTPGWDSWSNCTQFTGPVGCSVSFVRNNESFPIFQALLNALHRGVKVRILTNYYGVQTAAGMITPLDFLAVGGAQVRYYKTTTFMHAKYINADNTTVASSSVNFSYTSFMENREAGFIISGDGNGQAVSFFTELFNYDWNAGAVWPIQQTYNQSDMLIIKNTAPVQVNIPPPRNFSGSYVPPLVTVSTSFDTLGVTGSPDYAYSTIMNAMNSATKSLSVEIYQIENGTFCDYLISKHKQGLNVTVLVSDIIFSETDYELAKKCYTSMYYAGLTVRKTHYKMFTYTHSKFWIIDGTSVFVSSGNWGETDYPSGSSNVFPPYGNSNWRNANRDYTVNIQDSRIVNVFQDTLNGDYATGHDFYP